MTLTIRPITEDEFPAFVEADSHGFGYTVDPEELPRLRKHLELDRTLAVFDGDEVVATTAVFSFDMSIPGGTMPTGGVTWVAVKPTHRRRGVLTMMMRRQLQDISERGEAIAALFASESIIYGRFGYGLASQSSSLTIERTYGNFLHDVASPGSVRIVTPEEALTKWPACYDRARLQRPGMINRSPAFWDTRHINGEPVKGDKKRVLAQYEEDGEVRGFARYVWGENDGEDWLPDGTLEVKDLIAETPAAYNALWKLIFGTDLAKTVKAPLRPVDEPLYYALADPRRLQRRTIDSLWVRMVDVRKALEARSYKVAGGLTLAVNDDFRPDQSSKYRLDVAPEGAASERTTGQADIELHARDLGAVYLGSTRLLSLAQAGRVKGSPAAIEMADAMFAWPAQAWCAEVF